MLKLIIDKIWKIQLSIIYLILVIILTADNLYYYFFFNSVNCERRMHYINKCFPYSLLIFQKRYNTLNKITKNSKRYSLGSFTLNQHLSP